MNSVAFLLAVGASGPALADWEYTHWGMTPAQVAEASGGNVRELPKAGRKEAGDHSEIAAVGRFVMSGRTLSVGFQFNTVTNGLECVIYGATGDDVTIVRDTLTQKYGPTKEKPFGPGYSMEWTMPEPIEMAVTLKPLQSSVNHCMVGAT